MKREKKINQLNRQSDKKLTMQVRIDSELHRLLKIKASSAEISIKTLIEGYIADILENETIATDKI